MPYIATQDGNFCYDAAYYNDSWLAVKDSLIVHHGFCRSGDVRRTLNLIIEIQ